MITTSSSLDVVSKPALMVSFCLPDQLSGMEPVQVSPKLLSRVTKLMGRMRRLVLIMHHIRYDMYSMSGRYFRIERSMYVDMPIPDSRNQRYLPPMFAIMWNLLDPIGQ